MPPLPPQSKPVQPTVDLDRLWDFNDPAGTELGFRALVFEARAVGNLPYLAILYTQIARALGLQLRFPEAHVSLSEAEIILNAPGNYSEAEMNVPRIRYLLERGRVFNSTKQIDQAGPLFLAAFELASRTGEDHYAIDAAHMLGICLPAAAGAIWNERALEIAEKSADTRVRGWLGSIYNNLGWTVFGMNDFPRALQLLEAGLKFRQERGQERETRIAKWGVARALRALGRMNEALAMQEALLAEHEAIGSCDGFVFEELGECRLCLNRADEARPFFARAYEVLSKDPWLSRDEPARLQRIKELGAVDAEATL
jgi:tetratricopeptide (TPR) repeat protein